MASPAAKSRLAPPAAAHLFEPQKLRGLHLHGHDAANILQDAVLGLVDPADLTDRPVIQPHDDVSMGIPWQKREWGRHMHELSPLVQGGFLNPKGTHLHNYHNCIHEPQQGRGPPPTCEYTPPKPWISLPAMCALSVTPGLNVDTKTN